MTRFFVAILMVVVAALLVAFAIANRTPVTVAFDPFDRTAPAYVVTLPLYILAFIILILGVAVGGIVGWFTQGKRRRYRRRLESELNRVRAELDRAMREKATQEAALRGMRATATTVPARLPAN